MYLDDGHVVVLERVYQSVKKDAPSARKALATRLGIRRATKQHGLNVPAWTMLHGEYGEYAVALSGVARLMYEESPRGWGCAVAELVASLWDEKEVPEVWAPVLVALREEDWDASALAHPRPFGGTMRDLMEWDVYYYLCRAVRLARACDLKGMVTAMQKLRWAVGYLRDEPQAAYEYGHKDSTAGPLRCRMALAWRQGHRQRMWLDMTPEYRAQLERDGFVQPGGK